MIYTIGYQKLTLSQLEAIVREHGIDLIVDVRSVPYSRKPEFNRNNLSRVFGEQYIWKGDVLGGKGEAPISEGAIQWIVDLGDKKVLILMCMEEDPAKCHRHCEIARRINAAHNIDVFHITPAGVVNSRYIKGGFQCKLL